MCCGSVVVGGPVCGRSVWWTIVVWLCGYLGVVVERRISLLWLCIICVHVCSSIGVYKCVILVYSIGTCV